jgi:hypothetical protein
MKIGDLIEKYKGYGTEAHDKAGFRGLVIGFSRFKPKPERDRVLVLTGEGIIEDWLKSFCKVISSG